MTATQAWTRDRGAAAFAAATLTGLLGYALIAGLGFSLPQAAADALATFTVLPEKPPTTPPPPRPKVAPRVAHRDKPSGAASPPNLRALPTEVVALPPLVQLPLLPPPVITAPIADVGSAASEGNADIRGPGTGAGGYGNGRGSGGWGDGPGGGDGFATPPLWIRGRLKNSDYPREAGEAGVGGVVGVRYRVWIDGRVTECEVTRSSGSAVLDETTCRLIKQRFRFKPSRDEDGEPVPAVIVENHEWVIHQLPPEEGR